jgi:hypothetical protein
MATTCRTLTLSCAHPINVGHRGEIGLNGFLPHSQREEDVRAHVLRVPSVGRDSRIDSRRAQTEWRVRGIIVAVD